MSETDLHPVVEEGGLPANLKQLWDKAKAAAESKNDGYAVTICQSIVHQEPNFLQGRRLARRCAVRRKNSEKKGMKISAGGLGVMNIKNTAKKDPDGAMVELEKFLGDDPYSTQGNELLYDIAVAKGMVETAAFALETIFEGHPDNKKIGHRLGDYYLTHGEPSKAGKIFETMKQRDPTDLAAAQKAIAATAQDSMNKNKWDEGTSIKDLIKSRDEAQDLESKNRAGMTKDMIADQIAKCLEVYNEDQNNLNNVKRLADLYEQFEDFENAHTFYAWAHHLSSGDVALEAKVTRLKAKARDTEIQQLQEELADTPDPDKQAHLDELVHNRNEARISEAQAAVDRNPTDPALRFELGSAFYEDGLYSEAIQELQRAKNSPHIRTRVLLTLGKCFEHKGMNDLAVTQLDLAASELNVMDHTKKDILYTLGLIYERMEDQEKYLDALKQIYEADYGYKDVAQRVEASYS